MKNKVVYIVLLAITLVVAGVLEVVTLNGGPLMGDKTQVNPTLLYILQIVCSMSSLAGSFVAIKFKTLHPIVRMALIIAPANLVLLEYFMYYDTTLQFCLGILAISYLFIWNATEE